MHVESGRKGEVVVSGLTPLGGDTEGEGLHGLRDPPWGVSAADHTLGAPALGLDIRKAGPLDWFENQWDWQG